MQECLIRELSGRRQRIHRRWEELLRLEDAETPLSNPEALVHLIDWTLGRVFDGLRGRRGHAGGKSSHRVAALSTCCVCGHNPFFKHFLAGEQALLEALVLVQAEDPTLHPHHRDTAVTELYLVINEIARREIEALCSLCRRRARGQPTVALPAEPLKA